MLQKRNCFAKRALLASFVVTPRKETLFAGLYRKNGFGPLPSDLQVCPVRGTPVSNDEHIFYDLAPDNRLDNLTGRVVIEWGKAYLSWIQRADEVEGKPVIEIRTEQNRDEPFPGYRKFRWDLSDIGSIWPTWQDNLRQCKGIYLLTCKHCGQQYVGKADGDDGFWGRFLCYSLTGDGGNEGMKQHQTPGYFVTILEALATPSPGELDILESLWKEKLGSREWGLNKN